MTTSNSFDFNLTVLQIIEKAFKKATILAEGEDLTAEQVENAKEDLNLMISAWVADGAHLFTYKEIEMILEKGVRQYTLGPLGTGPATENLIKTALASAASAASFTIEVEDASEIQNGYFIYVGQSDGTLFKTTVNGAPAGNVVTLTDALAQDVLISARVYAYETLTTRPLKITQARRKSDANQEIPMSMLSRRGYFALPNKDDPGIAVQFYYNPTLNDGTLYVWPSPSDSQNTMTMTIEKEFDDADLFTNTLSFPKEWLEAIIYNLGSRLGIEYGIGDVPMSRISSAAKITLEKALAWDREDASIFLQPSEDWDEADAGDYYD